MTAYAWRISIIVAAAAKNAAEQAARAINSDGPGYEGDAFNVPMSPSGDEPVTHYGLCTSATNEMVAAMSAALPAIAGVMYWRNDIEGRLVASNVTPADNQAWDWSSTLAAAGLVPVSKPFG